MIANMLDLRFGLINLIFNVFTENIQTPYEKVQSDDILICETNDVKLDDSDEEKEKLNLNDEDKSIQAPSEKSMCFFYCANHDIVNIII